MFAVRSTSAVAVNAAAIRRVGAKKFNPLAAHVARKAPVAKARFSVQANSSSPSPDGEVDLYRDTPLRYMGYSNEVGEAFVAFLPSWGVPASYGVAGTSRARATSRTFEISARKRKISPRQPPARGRSPRAPEPDSAETDRADPGIPPLLTRSALYVLADTLDKGKKAADGEAGACPFTHSRDGTNANTSVSHPNRSTVQTSQMGVGSTGGRFSKFCELAAAPRFPSSRRLTLSPLPPSCRAEPKTSFPPRLSPTDESQKLKRGAIVSLDTFTWQMLASVFWPGSFIRCVVNATSTALALGHIDGDIAKALPTVVGLAAIPFIVKPIDGTIDTAMEMSVSKALNGKIEGPADAGIALGVIGACLVVPPTLFSVAAAIKDVAA